ncbi:MAG: DNA polymerase III subunit gamma/tau [Actinomycetota bacterium]
MAHLSLYRKHRPQTFADVVGQEHVTQTLRNAVSEARVAHAYLFSGPRGTGKTSTARILAKTLNCEKGPTPEPCNSCTSCIEITQGSSLDVVEYDAASHGSVEDARELREKVAYAPAGGRMKVYIIDECHMLSTAANNAMLKVLEEPPAHVVFVFATTEPHKVLQTLLDRCQRYEFRAIDAETIAEHVMKVCEAEGISIEEETAALIAQRAAGSARDALTLLEQLQSFAGDEVTVEDVGSLLGSVPEELLFEITDLVSERDVGAALMFADRLIRSGRDVREFTRALVDHLRSLFLVLHAPAAQEILDASDEKIAQLGRQANRFDHAELLRLLDLANETQLALREAIEARLALEVGLARMTRPDLHAIPASMLSRIERLERLAGINEQERAAAEPPKPVKEAPPREKKTPAKSKDQKPAASVPSVPDEAPASGGEVDLERIRRAWDVILQKVKKRKISFQALLLQADPVAWQEGELALAFSPRHKFHRDEVADTSKQGPLVEAFFDTFGVRPRINCVIREETAGRNEKEESTPEGTMSGNGPQKSPKDALDLIREGFEAEIVEES